MLHARTRIPVLLFTAVMTLLSLTRLVIYMAMGSRFVESSPHDVLIGFLYGLRYDAVIACMLVAPLLAFLIPAPPMVVSHRIFRWAVAIYCGLVTAAVLFLGVCDFYFFQEFGERPNEKVLQYFGYDYVLRTVVDQYPLVQALFAAGLVVAGSTWFFLRYGFDDRYNVTPLWQAIAWPGLTVALVVLGIRGSVGPKSLNSGAAFFSGSVTLTQLTLNGGFTLREAVIGEYFKAVKLKDRYPLLPETEAVAIAKQAIARPQDRFLGDPDNPLRRITDTGKPRQDYNVVLVILESMNWPYIGPMGGDPLLTPNLNALADSGVLMDHCFAVGGRTTRGVCGIVGGFPDLPGDSVTTRPAGHSRFLTLGSVLHERGYETMFIYGGQPYYDHRQAFLGGNGYSRFVFEDDFAQRTFRTHLGWCDGDLFDTAHETFEGMDGRPFFATLLTLAFHRDYKVPEGKADVVYPDHRHSDQLNAVHYTDWAIGRFMDKARGSEYFDRTVFVFVADHGGGFLSGDPHPSGYRVPFIIYAPAVLGAEGRRVATVCSQMDVAPTILSLLGGQYKHTFFGSDVLSRPEDQGLAMTQISNRLLLLIDGENNAVSVPPRGGEPRLMRFDLPDRFTPIDPLDSSAAAKRDELTRRATALLQTADLLFRRKAYNNGEVDKPQPVLAREPR